MTHFTIAKDSVLLSLFDYNDTEMKLAYKCFNIGRPNDFDNIEYYKTKRNLNMIFIDENSSYDSCNVNDIFSMNIVPREDCNRYRIITDLDKKHNNPDGYIKKEDLSVIIFDKKLIEKVDFDEADELYKNM